MAEFPSMPTGYERRLPPGVQVVVATRRRAIASEASGRILDLGGSDSHERLWRPSASVTRLDNIGDPSLLRLLREGQQFDTIVSIFQLIAAPDLEATVQRLADLLAPGGKLCFLEPARRIGITGRVQTSLAPMLGVTTGWRFDRDIPFELRSNGLSVVDLERHRFPTTQPWLRSGVEGRAHVAKVRLVADDTPQPSTEVSS